MNDTENQYSWTGVLIPVALILGLALLLGLNSAAPAEEAAVATPLESLLRVLVGYLAAGAEIAAALVIGFAILQSLVLYLRQILTQPGRGLSSSENIRLRLGRSLALGLEFTVASDILMTAVAPTHQDILNLAAIILLRSLLNYFLEREIRMGEENRRPESEKT